MPLHLSWCQKTTGDAWRRHYVTILCGTPGPVRAYAPFQGVSPKTWWRAPVEGGGAAAQLVQSHQAARRGALHARTEPVDQPPPVHDQAAIAPLFHANATTIIEKWRNSFNKSFRIQQLETLSDVWNRGLVHCRFSFGPVFQLNKF